MIRSYLELAATRHRAQNTEPGLRMTLCLRARTQSCDCVLSHDIVLADVIADVIARSRCRNRAFHVQYWLPSDV